MKPTSQTRKVFIVEDDPIYVRMLKYILELNPDHEVHCFATGKECVDNLNLQPSIITLDYTLPDMSGSEVLREIKNFDPDINVIILSGQQDISTAIQLLREGVYEYITKDDETKERLLNTINHIYQNEELKQEVDTLKSELTHRYEFNNTIKGNSSAMTQIFGLMEKAARTNITVSITGETGTGKEMVAKAIHYNSKRKQQPFVAVNIAAIPADLLESELFGHEKGAFTGAVTRRIGKFEQASGGTLFLDEIAEMDVSLQAKLLRALQEKEITRIGSNEIIKIDARIIVATNRNLQDEVKKNNFREDLYYRILGLPIHLPPLRDRGNDILILAKFFLDQFCEENGMSKKDLSPEARTKLLSYHYPGNVRELKAVIELAAVMANRDAISPEDIHFNTSSPLSEMLPEEATLREYNQRIINYYLEKYDNNVVLVANKLGIGKSTVYRMLKEEEA